MKIDELRNYRPQQKQKQFGGPVDYHGVPIELWNHPGGIAHYILSHIKYTHTFGCQFIAPMGYGKTTAASIIAHFIHKKDDRFQVIWAESTDFMHLKRFLLALPKEPMIIIFDDITGSLKQMAEKDIEKNFEDLTKIRWIIDPTKGEIPVIVFVNYHYSKNLEKEFRAVLGMTVFLGFGAEEYTNIDTILPKKSPGRQTLEYFSKMVDRMFTSGKFSLLHGNGQVIEYKTDAPCRASCAVMGKDARIILMSKDDMCKKCAKSNFKKYADPKEIVAKIQKIYHGHGTRALRLALAKRGFYTFNPTVNTALEYVENRLFTQFDVRYDQLADEIQKNHTPKKGTRIYHKRREETEMLEDLEDTAEKIEVNENG